MVPKHGSRDRPHRSLSPGALVSGTSRWYHRLRRQAKKCRFYRGFLTLPLRPLGSASYFKGLRFADRFEFLSLESLRNKNRPGCLLDSCARHDRPASAHGMPIAPHPGARLAKRVAHASRIALDLMPHRKSVFAEIDCEGSRRASRSHGQQGDGDLSPSHIKIITHHIALHNFRKRHPQAQLIFLFAR
jgi:hypothetical protein